MISIAVKLLSLDDDDDGGGIFSLCVTYLAF
jgi:hypothetical protein